MPALFETSECDIKPKHDPTGRSSSMPLLDLILNCMNHPRSSETLKPPQPPHPQNIQKQLLHWTWGLFHGHLQTHGTISDELPKFTINVKPRFHPAQPQNQPIRILVPGHPSAVPDPATPPRSLQAAPAPSQASAAARPAAQPWWSAPAR